MMKQIMLEALPEFLNKIAETCAVIAPIEQADQVDFGIWSEDKTLRLDVLKTVKSAKGAFFPQIEDMVRFHMDGKNIHIHPEEVMDEEFVIFGVRACDAKSFELLDRVFLADPVDPFYAARRSHGTVVTLACSEPDETCFCTNFGIDASDPAGDVTCWVDGERLFLRENTEKGKKLAQQIVTEGMSVQNRVDEGISEEELASFYDTMNKLCNNLKIVAKEREIEDVAFISLPNEPNSQQ